MAKCSDIPDAEILEAVDAYHRYPLGHPLKPKRATQALAHKYPEKVLFAKLDKLLKRGFIEFGTNISGSWLTPKGRTYMQLLKENP